MYLLRVAAIFASHKKVKTRDFKSRFGIFSLFLWSNFEKIPNCRV